jgi:DNA-binding XRE family transcriptional regulator
MTTIDSNRFKDEALVLALAVVGERIRDLPKEDRDDIFEVTKAFVSAEDDAERESAARALLEILEQAKGTTRVFRSPTNLDPLQEWTSFISKKIKDLRATAGMTQEQLSEKSGLTQSHISRLEAGQHSPNAITLQKIASALGVSISDLDPNAPASQ